MAAIHLAAQSGNLQMLNAILNGENTGSQTLEVNITQTVNDFDELGITPLEYAIINNHPNIVARLLQEQDLIDPTTLNRNVAESDFRPGGYGPLYYACEAQNAEILEMLANDQRFDPNVRTYRGMTPLDFASEISNDFVNVLLNSGRVNLNFPSPLFSAWSARRYEIIQNLILRGVNPTQIRDHQNPDQRLSLLQAICINSDIAGLELLINIPDVNFNLPDQQGRTAFYDACQFGNDEMVARLLALYPHRLNNLDPTLTEGGSTAFMAACQSGNQRLVQLLLDNDDVDVDGAINDDGDTAFSIVCATAEDELAPVLQVLLNSNRIDFSYVDDEGYTGFYYLLSRFDRAQLEEFVDLLGDSRSASRMPDENQTIFSVLFNRVFDVIRGNNRSDQDNQMLDSFRNAVSLTMENRSNNRPDDSLDGTLKSYIKQREEEEENEKARKKSEKRFIHTRVPSPSFGEIEGMSFKEYFRRRSEQKRGREDESTSADANSEGESKKAKVSDQSSSDFASESNTSSSNSTPERTPSESPSPEDAEQAEGDIKGKGRV